MASTSTVAALAAKLNLEATALKSDTKQTNWAERYIKVENSHLTYYARKGSEKKGDFDLARLAPGFLLPTLPSVPGSKPPPHSNILVLVMPSGRPLCISFPDAAVYAEWHRQFTEMSDAMGEATSLGDVSVSVDGAAAGAGAVEDVPIKAHGLVHKLDAAGKKWQQRWFELDGYKLTYRKKEGQTSVRGTIDLSKLAVGFLVENYTNPSGANPMPTTHGVALNIPDRVFGMCFADPEDKEYWLGWFRYAHLKLHPPTDVDKAATAVSTEAAAVTSAAAAVSAEASAVSAEAAAMAAEVAAMTSDLPPEAAQFQRNLAATKIGRQYRESKRSEAATRIQMSFRRRAVDRRVAARTQAPVAAAVAGSAHVAAGDASAVSGEAATVSGDAAAVSQEAAAVSQEAAAVSEEAAAVSQEAQNVSAPHKPEPTPASEPAPAAPKGCCVVM